MSLCTAMLTFLVLVVIAMLDVHQETVQSSVCQISSPTGCLKKLHLTKFFLLANPTSLCQGQKFLETPCDWE